MDGWTHNQIGDMYGPAFLLLYGSVIVATLFACWWKMSNADSTAQMNPLPVATDPDPFEIAYLRGGENDVSRLAIFDLIERGYLQIVEEPKQSREGGTERRLTQVPMHPDSRHLSTLERAVFDWFSGERTAAEVFESSTLSERVKYHCAAHEQSLLNEQLLYPEEAKQAAWGVGLTGALVITLLGGYKLMVALEKGRSNVEFLIVMGIVSLVVLIYICRTQRLSYRGREYLENLQQAFDQLKARCVRPDAPALANPAAPDPAMLLLVSLFGVSVLAGTAYASFEQEFHRASSGGGGCGGGGCGGGGCGGGGCGGGGCGGG